MKSNTIKITILFGIMLINTYSGFCQERVVTGKVTCFENIPISGAEIKVRSSKQIVLTDSLGIYSLSCLSADKLKFSAHGFLTQNVKLEEKHRIVLVNLHLRSNPKSLDVAIGFGHVKEDDNLMPVSSLREEELDFSHYSDVYEIITGRFAGVQIENGEIIIRGRRTITGSDAALLVVDGLLVDKDTFAAVSTNDIARIDILKGPAASIYGVRGANGVVMVETKRGKNR